jgi:hypothetical protein
MLMRSVEDDEDAQKRGVIGCAYCVGIGGFDFDLQLVRKSAKLRNAFPARFDAVHVCYNDPLMIPILSLALIAMATHNRMRFRTHYGSDKECQSQLSSFGIPISALPVSPRGEFNLENHRAFVPMQRAIEATNKSKSWKGPPRVAQKGKKTPEEKAGSRQSTIKEDAFAAVPQPDLNEPTGYGASFMNFGNFGFLPLPSFANPLWSLVGAPNFLPVVVPYSQRKLSTVVPQSHILVGPTKSANRPPAKFCESPAKPFSVIYDPLPNDILLGRGKPTQDRPGNVRFREMIDKHVDEYDKDKNGAKVTVLRILKEEGGRFLKELEVGGWAEVDEAAARAKVSHAFRTRRPAYQATLKKDKRTA